MLFVEDITFTEETVVREAAAILGTLKLGEIRFSLVFACRGEVYGVEEVVAEGVINQARSGPAAAKEMIRRDLFRQMGDKVYEVYFGVAEKQGEA